MLEQLEGKRNYAYRDEAGYLTIGIGHLLNQDEIFSGKIYIYDELVKYTNGLTNDHCYRLLQQDIHKYKNVVEVMARVDLNLNQITALVSFCFNVGMQAFIKSTLLKLLNDGNYDAVPEQLKRWRWAGGRVSKILENRRKKEIEVWRTPV